MVTISNVDLVMAALRSRLQKVAADRRVGKTRAAGPSRLAQKTQHEGIEALAAMRHLPEEEFDRTLVRAMLEAELGEAITTDPRFHHLVSQTTRILRESPELQSAFREIQSGKA